MIARLDFCILVGLGFGLFGFFFLTERNSISALSNKFCRGGGYDTYGDDLTKDVCFINEGYLDLCRRQGRRVWVQKYI